MSETRTDISKENFSNRGGGVLTSTGLHLVREKKDYQVLKKVFSLIADFTSWCTENG